MDFNASDAAALVLGNLSGSVNFTDASNYRQHSAATTAVLSVVLVVVIAWTILGNLTVIVSVLYMKGLRSAPTNALIANLAVSDLLLGCLVLPFSAADDLLGYWPLGRHVCYMWLVVDVLLCTASIWSLLVIALDRYIATFHPIWYRSRQKTRRTILYIVLVWIISVLTSVPPLFGFGGVNADAADSVPVAAVTARAQCVLFASLGYVLYSSVMTFFVPTPILFILYGKIFFTLRQRARRRAQAKQHSTTFKNNSAAARTLEPGGGAGEGDDSLAVNYSRKRSEEITIDDPATYEATQRDEEEAPATESAIVQSSSTSSPLVSNRVAKELERSKKSGPRALLRLKRLSQRASKRQSERKEKREERATKIMLTVMLIFIVCWLPFFVMYITRGVLSVGRTDTADLPADLEEFFIWLGYINSSINPLLYTAFNIQFRRAFKVIWCRVLCRRHGNKPGSASV